MDPVQQQSRSVAKTIVTTKHHIMTADNHQSSKKGSKMLEPYIYDTTSFSDTLVQLQGHTLAKDKSNKTKSPFIEEMVY
jgi:hypothetical protein